ncbi:MAG: DUF72 domain-containing protein [Thermoprotei archaeon]
MVLGCSGLGGLRAGAYKERFRALEVQSTFYRFPREESPVKWRNFYGQEFVFTNKAYQGLTHEQNSPTWKSYPRPEGDPEKLGGLKPTEENFALWEKTLKVSGKLGSKVVVVQLPPSFAKTTENLGNLAAFFGSVEAGPTVGVEFRHRSWFESGEEFAVIAKRYDLLSVVDPFKHPPIFVGDTLYLRLHGRGRGYKYVYTDSELRDLCRMIRGYSPERCFVFFNNTSMVEDALRFKAIWEAEK